MKQFLPLIIIVLCTYNVFGQSYRVTSASNNLKYNELEKALENLKAASKHRNTKYEAKTWLYLGHTYYAIDTASQIEYSGLVEAPKNKAVDAYSKAMKLDESGQFKSKIQGNAVRVGVSLFNAGAQDYNKALKAKKKKETSTSKNYFKESLEHFESHFATRKLAGKYGSYINQTLTQNNIDPKKTLLYAGYSAYQIGQFDKAITYLSPLVKQDSKYPDAYLFLSNLHLKKGDTSKAIDVLVRGKENVQKTEDLQNRMLRIYQQTGQTNKLVKKLKKAIKKILKTCNYIGYWLPHMKKRV